MSDSDISAVTAEITVPLTRVFAVGSFDDGLDLDATDENPPDLSPTLLSERIGTSRATLYRLFAPMGGIMRYVQERRLLAVRDVLNDPLDRRSLAQPA